MIGSKAFILGHPTCTFNLPFYNFTVMVKVVDGFDKNYRLRLVRSKIGNEFRWQRQNVMRKISVQKRWVSAKRLSTKYSEIFLRCHKARKSTRLKITFMVTRIISEILYFYWYFDLFPYSSKRMAAGSWSWVFVGTIFKYRDSIGGSNLIKLQSLK